MALNIPSTQIYAGRYHHKKMEMPNLLDEKQQAYTEHIPCQLRGATRRIKQAAEYGQYYRYGQHV